MHCIPLMLKSLNPKALCVPEHHQIIGFFHAIMKLSKEQEIHTHSHNLKWFNIFIWKLVQFCLNSLPTINSPAFLRPIFFNRNQLQRPYGDPLAVHTTHIWVKPLLDPMNPSPSIRSHVSIFESVQVQCAPQMHKPLNLKNCISWNTTNSLASEPATLSNKQEIHIPNFKRLNWVLMRISCDFLLILCCNQLTCYFQTIFFNNNLQQRLCKESWLCTQNTPEPNSSWTSQSPAGPYTFEPPKFVAMYQALNWQNLHVSLPCLNS